MQNDFVLCRLSQRADHGEKEFTYSFPRMPFLKSISSDLIQETTSDKQVGKQFEGTNQ